MPRAMNRWVRRVAWRALVAVSALDCTGSRDVTARAIVPSLAGSTGASEQPIEATSPTAAALASNQLAFDLYDRLRQDEGNLVFSPVSLSLALAMALAGARNETAAQIAHVLHVSPAPGAHDGFGELIGSLNEGHAHAPSTLRIADRVWVQSGMQVQADFRTRMRDSYRAPLGEVDFGDPVGAAATVNAWAKQETFGRISHVLAPDRLTTSTRFVLASAVFFKGIWRTVPEERPGYR